MYGTFKYGQLNGIYGIRFGDDPTWNGLGPKIYNSKRTKISMVCTPLPGLVL
jgi:hypothetical protein